MACGNDGGLMFWFPDADRWVALFLAFQSQSWHTDDRTGDPIPGNTGAEPAFDQRGRRLPVAERIRPPIDLVAVRVTDTPRAKAAILLLNPMDQTMALTGWSLATAPSNRRSLTGVVPAGQPLAIDMPESFFDAAGGVVTLLDASGLKVAAHSPASCPRSTMSSRPLAASHTRAVLSCEPVTMRVPSGLKAALSTASACPRRTEICAPVTASQTRVVPSSDAVMIRLPSGL